MIFNFLNTFEEGWKNKLIWGNNLLVMGSLLEKFAGKIDLIYIDRSFATGSSKTGTADNLSQQLLAVLSRHGQ
jgi:adenine specific DNA methylase Mod